MDPGSVGTAAKLPVKKIHSSADNIAEKNNSVLGRSFDAFPWTKLLLPVKMIDLNKGNQMSAITVTRPDRVAESAEILANYRENELACVIIRRLGGEAVEQLPPVARDEQPRSIFIEIARSKPKLRETLRTALVHLLRHAADREIEDPLIVGEICSLSAVLDAEQAVKPLIVLVASSDLSNVRLSEDEDLRLRALRSLVGLLGAHRSLEDAGELERVLESLLGDKRYELLALAALVGLCPERRSELLGRAAVTDVSELDLILEWAGFVEPTAEPKDRQRSA
jgi:hypothetical protein